MKGSKGRNNPRWNGGTSEYPDHYKMKKLRLEKLESVNYTCEKCGGKANEVHHRDGTKTNHSLDNFLVVCHACHMRLHRKYSQDYTLSELSALIGLNVSIVNRYFLHPETISERARGIIDDFLSRLPSYFKSIGTPAFSPATKFEGRK